ncbi:GH36-type glycosyl hydrolase domain-containing protein [Brucella pseudogrignonensis]|uniref:Cyclic beta-1,2-glucan synthetase n=1 Tax=Brucella pseudogrignonensis TaxID=419475 RepID=A0ABU1M978_9HYPH|nr:glucoamylase family protein [Brucella pseudogrignonensis]MDR6432589.1 cyclic beta-1,2-glucan synthetase [Brucella pseudogrignonensis]
MPELSSSPSNSSIVDRKTSDQIPPEQPSPIRALYKSEDELRELAASVARGDVLALPGYQSFEFDQRLSENGKLILHAYRSSDAASRAGETITPAAQWLLDNHYQVDKTAQQTRRDLPRKFIRQLPTYAAQKDMPRIFALAWLYVAHTDSNFSLKSLTALVQGFQSVEPLKIGELWALPSAVRYFLIENVRRLALRVDRARNMRNLANTAADRIVIAANEHELETVLAQYAHAARDSTFATHLLYRLRSASTDTSAASIWLERILEQEGSNAEDAIVEEHARQSTGGVTMGNAITSLKRIDDIDWETWFETVNEVDAILRDHSDFELLDFRSRNAYRVTIEKLARFSDMSEIDITWAALKLAEDSKVGEAQAEGKGSIAYFLSGDGRKELEQLCGYKAPFGTKALRFYRGLGLLGLFIPTAIFTVIILTIVHYCMMKAGLSADLRTLFTLLALFPAMDASYSLFNALVPRFVQPTRLIGFEYKEGLPAEARTLVAVPTLITSRDSIDEQIRNLEVHYLTNPRGEIYFSLVSDWTDAKQEITPADMEIYEYAREEIVKLNAHYTGDEQPRFFLLHRRRLYNEKQGCWMGWERKRGKLHELNLLLRGDQDTSYFAPDARLPKDIKYVMTLDADTRLTPEAVTHLVGKLSHPLNRPVFDEKTGRVVRGYGILQPRVTPSLTTGDEASFLQRVFSVNRGIDPYVFAVSDTYQDLLGEGTFTGKGLYDIDAFEVALKNRVPENTLLSHDLLEGGYARAALVSDVEVVEDYPTGYNVDVSRHHRWARGDWQLLPWLFSTSRGVSAVTRWKMVDNLRRSLNPIMWLIASVIGWSILPIGVASVWQAFLIVSMFVAPTFGILTNLIPSNMDYSLKGHAQSVLTDVALGTADVALRTTFIAHSAFLMADAIVRTIYRLFVSHRDMLEWKTAAQAKSSPDTLLYYFQLMWPAIIIAGLAVFIPLGADSHAALIAAPFAVIWFASPLIAWLVSRSAKPQDTLEVLSSDKADLRRYARRTWRYFAEFSNEENNHLPPDNFQEDPAPIVAQRTSPTNIGVYVLSVVAARDFGWIGFDETLNRLSATVTTLEKMEKYQGHLYNWYETNTLTPMRPLYVSAVDSGNLAGHLVTLSSALEEWAEAPSVYLQADLDGILDVNDILEESIAQIPDDRRILRPLRRRLEERIANFRRAVRTIKEEPETASFRTINLSLFATDIVRLMEELDSEIETAASAEAKEWANILVDTCKAHTDDSVGEHNTDELRERLQDLAGRARQLAFDMQFGFLERKERRLLSIGFRVQENELDESCYDLLASEARLASLFAIAKGDVPVEHWFKLGRLLVPVGWKGALLSWSGSMFEYLMPPLVMSEPLGSLLDQTNKLVVQRQIDYATSRGLPWGISEAAFNARDAHMNYQYSNFGVPNLGLQRGLSRNAVIAPYASLLAAQYQPAAAVANLKRLAKLGALGRYGFHDSVDFTPSRVREGETYAVVKNYYAHHHGMAIIAVNNVIFEGRMRERFHSDPVIEAAELLLQEKAPREIPMIYAKTENPMRVDSGGFDDAPMRIIDVPFKAPRTTHMMSNGQYALMVTANGSGYSRWHNWDITRFHADASEDLQGSFLFLRDMESGYWWSATGEPVRNPDEETKTVFTEDKAEFYKTAGDIKTVVEVIVSSESDGEGRRLDIINTSARDRVIEVTSYSELVLTDSDSDAAHPAFAKMFVETEISDNGSTIYAKRRKRAPSDPDIHVAHFVTDLSGSVRETEVETDRRAFIGRGRSLRDAVAFDEGAKFTGSQGCVLDPIASVRTRVRVPAHKKVSLVFWTFAGGSRDAVEHAVATHRHPETFVREYSLSWTSSQVQLYHIGIKPAEAADYQKVAAYLLYPERTMRQPPETIAAGLGKQSNLWPMSISGDYPIFALRIDNEVDLDVLRGVLRAQEYWRSKGLTVDVVAVNERAFSYAQDTQRAIDWIIEGFRARGGGQPHIFAVRRDQMSEESYNTLLASARIVMHAQNGSLAEQLRRSEELTVDLAARGDGKTPALQQGLGAAGLAPAAIERGTEERRLVAKPKPAVRPAPTGDDLQFWNGYGGFAEDGSYVVRINNRVTTPHPWINVIANPNFGFHVSAEGSAFTWAGNSRDYQLTPWANDPVTNRPGEAIYILDRETGRSFAPTASVLRDEAVTYEARHSHGYSTFAAQHGELALELTHIVDAEKPVRLSRLTITNKGRSKRKLRVYGYAEWVLGNARSKNVPFIVPSQDEELGALFAGNPYHPDKSGQVAFFAATEKPQSVTADRGEFIGSTGSVDRPEIVLAGKALSNTVEAGRDPCAALAIDVEVGPGESREVVFLLGNAADQQQAKALVTESRKASFDEKLNASRKHWDSLFNRVQVKTPDPAFDLLINGWLPYQAIACRIWARAAFYQASGAFGFRDQLQDTLSLLLIDPSLARAQILNAASRQFPEGDVQHWWLPATGAGVRTLISDDVVWLGYGTSLYVQTTGDHAILDEKLAFLKGRTLEEGEHDAFFEPEISDQTVSLYEHCALALDLAIKRTGKHGLPLMLGGDWNDGMNLVGVKGEGESVWLGWFLAYTLRQFIPIAESRKDSRAKAWAAHLESLTKALDRDGWDGEWYRRGFFDNGAPLGSKDSDECQIDAIAQSWSVLSGVADPKRSEQAMASLEKHLLDDQGELLRLFTPPFDKTVQEPGYIKGYPPGVRENGGQYTHGATWAILALARMGKAAEAWKLFSLISPVNHGRNPDTYRVEPYVIAADIYSVEPRRGQGGWTWYTGSAGWFYRVATEGILGVTKRGDRLHLDPALPPEWDGYEAELRFGEALYRVKVVTGAKTKAIKLDGRKVTKPEDGVIIKPDGEHEIIVELPKSE